MTEDLAQEPTVGLSQAVSLPPRVDLSARATKAPLPPTSALSVGSHTIAAYYGGMNDPNGPPGVASSSYTINQQVEAVSTSTALTSSATLNSGGTYTSYYGQPVTFTATVGCSDDPDWTPGGCIEFGPPYGSGGAPYPVFATAAPTHQSTDAPNTYSATYTASAFSVGQFSIEAYYTGDQGIATTSSQTITQQVVAVPTTTTLTSSSPGSAPSYTSYYGDTVTFTAVVTSSDTSYSPSSSATVEFYDGSSCIGSATSAPYTLSTSTLAVASHTITAVYQDGPNVTASTAAITQTVSLVPTTTTLTSSSPTTAPNTYSSYYGQSVTFTATVSSSYSAWTHSGIVEFGPPYGIGGAPYPVFATAAPTHQSTDAPNTYSATFTASAFSLGEYSIEAYYTGAQTDASSSYTITQQVLPMPVTTTVSAFANGSAIGYHSDAGPYPSYPFWEPISFWGTVLTGSVAPTTGYVTLYNNGTAIATGTLVGTSGAYTAAPTFLAPLENGCDTITATYGDGSDSGNFVQNPGSYQCTPYQVPTWLGLAGPENPLYGQPGAITAVLEHDATFAPYVPGGQATGSVDFYDNGVYLGSQPLDEATGQATLPTSGLAVGLHTITRQLSRRLLVP